MNETRTPPTAQARIERVTYSGGCLRAAIQVRTGNHIVQYPVAIQGLDCKRATALVGAMGRLLTGAVVLDGADLLAIHDAIDNARGLASMLAPDADGSVALLASIERTQAQCAGLVA